MKGHVGLCSVATSLLHNGPNQMVTIIELIFCAFRLLPQMPSIMPLSPPCIHVAEVALKYESNFYFDIQDKAKVIIDSSLL